MSLRSILSSDQILISGFIVSIFSAIIFSIDGVTAAILFLCGVFIGATLTREFLRGYSSKEIFTPRGKENWAVTSSSNQAAKFLFLSIIIIIVLIGGVILFGGGIPIFGSGGGDVVAGTVYNDTTPVVDERVTLKNGSSNDQLASTTTNENGEFEFNTTESSGPYTVEPESEDYDPRGDVSDGKTDIVFGEAPGILSGLPIIGGDGNADAPDSENNESSADDSSSDIEPTNDTETTDSSNVTDEESQGQSIRYVEGSVVREEDGQTEPVASAMVTLEDSEDNVISAEANETTQEGGYRIDNIKLNDFEGDIESGQVYIIAEKEDEFIAEEEVDLSIRESPYEINQTITVTQEDNV